MSVESPQIRFTRYLESKGLKMTRQRVIILEEFLCQDDHVSAEELYERLRSRYPGLGQATIFRTLHLVADAGLAQEVRIDHKTVRYERSGIHHDHIQCLNCGDVYEFRDERIEALQEEIAAKFGIRLVRHHLDLFGICAKCAALGQS